MVEASYGKGTLAVLAALGFGGGIVGTLLALLVIVIVVALILRVLHL